MKVKAQPNIKYFTKQFIDPTGMIHKVKLMQYVYKKDDTKKKKVVPKSKKSIKKPNPPKKVTKPKVKMG